MSNDFTTLKEIGAQKIHEQTHIPKKHVDAILDKKFHNMNKIQFLGFISILEREFSLKLGELKEVSSEYFVDNTEDMTSSEKLFIASKKRNLYAKYYILLAILILIIVAVSNTIKEEKVVVSPKIDNTKITQVTQKIVTKIDVPEDIEEFKEEIVVPKVLKIIPNVKLWMGYINLNTGKKFQKTFNDEFELDPDGHWLLTLGHGDVSFEINGKLDEYKTQKNLRFEYKNSELKKISYSEFLVLNKGEKW